MFRSARAAAGLPIVACLAFCLTVAPTPNVVAQEVTESEQWTIEEVWAAALEDNPDLDALYAEWQSAIDRANAAGARLPQPRLSYTGYILPVETRQGPQRHVLSISQAFPWPGTLSDAEAPALAEARSTAAAFDEEVLRMRLAIEEEFVRIARLDEQRAILLERQGVIGDVMDHQESILAYSDADYVDLIRLGLTVELINDRLADLQGEREIALTELRGLARSAEGFDVDLQSITFDVSDADTLPDANTLADAAAERHPMFERLRARSEVAVAQAEVSRNGALPMPSIMLGWGIVGTYDQPLPNTGNGGNDVLMIGLSIPLPIFRAQYDAAMDAALATADGFQARAESGAWELTTHIDGALTRIAEEQARIEHYETDLLPLAADAVEALDEQLAHGESNHVEYLLAFEQLVALESTLVDARWNIVRDLARIDHWTAGYVSELTGVEDLDAPTLGEWEGNDE